ncbi:peptidylprolyl isomerase [Synechococcus sp. MVIR-18-1]|uniref:peptidylprolyl isomerase n=1 Tax=Synechococcus sp. MVIR-18-1 TaxID=1386941 RepID=UPI001646BC22|nr:peptidylprolyl isomerase [Synechococcus sp. MVIR-18-1]QNI75798.1 peptidyl-prolyl cis-trans isomerase/ PpiC-type [Synechococcus sp. MVIR-18-1]
MTETVKIFDQKFKPEDLFSLLYELELLPLMIKKYIQKESCSHIKPSEEEQVLFQTSFLQREKISNQQQLEIWLSANSMSEPQLSKQMYHALQLKKSKEEKFGNQAGTTFLENKDDLDQAMYSMIRSSERAKAYELYLRINEEEDTFADLASDYSEGVEKQLNGLIGPIELGRLNPEIAERLRISKKGQLWEPFEEQGWWVILRLERLLPAKLDEAMEERIINDLYNSWIQKEVKKELVLVLENNSHLKELYTPKSPQAELSETETNRNSTIKRVWDRFSRSKNNNI